MTSRQLPFACGALRAGAFAVTLAALVERRPKYEVYLRVPVGVTAAEAEELLGGPPLVTRHYQGGPGPMEVRAWRKGRHLVLVDFRDGRAVGSGLSGPEP